MFRFNLPKWACGKKLIFEIIKRLVYICKCIIHGNEQSSQNKTDILFLLWLLISLSLPLILSLFSALSSLQHFTGNSRGRYIIQNCLLYECSLFLYNVLFCEYQKTYIQEVNKNDTKHSWRSICYIHFREYETHFRKNLKM